MSEIDIIAPEHRFGFTGNWREFLPIALSNALLTLVTLGIYRFWAIKRERDYLWSHTWFLDDWLEWTGTGKELLLGFITAAFLLGIPLFILQFGIQAMVYRGYGNAAIAVSLLTLLFFNFFVGVARFRALRYRLNRTYWKGIRGGSDEPGWTYGWSNLWKWVVNYLSLGSAVAWTMTSLWNDRWNEMSFGNLDFDSKAKVRPVLVPFVFLYLTPLLILIVSVTLVLVQGTMVQGVYIYMDAPPLFRIIFFLIIASTSYAFVSLLFVIYYAAFYRNGVANLELGGLRFSFEAEGGEWFILLLVDGLIIIATLGIGYFFLGYRHWAFFAKHLAIHGDLDETALRQTSTKQEKYSDGWLDAMDIGAF
ncbi:YjgN family protein [Sphingorhabdus sp.]|uniref:YjgN family protein n=2 Tax=Sphingorhabdus sp. TaxID=1902408 RepID=UPI003BAEAA30|nr:DUF898 domain-containing protein [Sphingomonadales bacterium]